MDGKESVSEGKCEGKSRTMEDADQDRRTAISGRRCSTTSSIRATSTLSQPDVDKTILATALVLSVIMKDAKMTDGPHARHQETLMLFDQGQYSSERPTIPEVKVIFTYLDKILKIASFNPESLIMSLVYINRLIKNTGVQLGASNWRLITLMSLLLAQKVWDDIPLTNVDFTIIWDETVPGANSTSLNIKAINIMERSYLELLQYSMHVTASLYAKFYFELRALAGPDSDFPEPLSREEASHLEARSAYQEQQCSTSEMKRAFTMVPQGKKGKGSAKSRAIIS